ncbi:uncharacterized protein V6R79_017318 [Siganus canaliculatus]
MLTSGLAGYLVKVVQELVHSAEEIVRVKRRNESDKDGQTRPYDTIRAVPAALTGQTRAKSLRSRRKVSAPPQQQPEASSAVKSRIVAPSGGKHRFLYRGRFRMFRSLVPVVLRWLVRLRRRGNSRCSVFSQVEWKWSAGRESGGVWRSRAPALIRGQSGQQRS